VGTPQALEEDLARRINAAQALSGKRTEELATELGWHISKLWRVKRGDQVPDAIELNQVAAATGVPLDFFFGAASEGVEVPNLSPLPGAVKEDNSA
jgi:transcriptional regulator with XRE-family HTH domain